MEKKSTEDRYARQMLLRGFGGDGQKRPADASVLVTGTGDLGGPGLFAILNYIDFL